jgi:hypothetical protein
MPPPIPSLSTRREGSRWESDGTPSAAVKSLTLLALTFPHLGLMMECMRPPAISAFRSVSSAAVACLLLAGSSCALLFPDRTAPKDAEYHVTTPPAPWTKLAVTDDPSAVDAMKADRAYENPETGAIISVNSICRKYNKTTLETLTDNLVRGVGERKLTRRDEITLDGEQALDSTFEGVVDGVFLNLRTVVLIKNDCTYDFIHVSIPKREKGGGRAFDDFVASFHGG